ncbi:unnamed protein product [Caenorhabditis angaria]|uniref:Uncharacterized protein n=1 Tax=Caenorhabditis angaria TaxID=860376 RepID=A0A9P1IHD0_9PELO|nr:unnamed protein product [Caenorhabditis angaria]
MDLSYLASSPVQVPLQKSTQIVKFSGFDDDEIDFETSRDNQYCNGGGNSKFGGEIVGEKKRRRGGRKNRRRMNAGKAENMLAIPVFSPPPPNHTPISPTTQQNSPKLQFLSQNALGKNVHQNSSATPQNPQNLPAQKMSRLMRELHERERVRGMDRFEARQLLQDKLLFRGETNLSDIRLRRFCIVVISREQFEIPELSMKIPAETISISMENGKISSILRLVPSFDENPNESSQIPPPHQKYRSKTIFWNPTRCRDSNMMFKMWNHFLDRCLHSLLLCTLSQFSILLEFLRTINEIRSILNQRMTASICLSRLISIDDFLISCQQLADVYNNLEAMPHKKNQTTLNFGLELCSHFISSMKTIASFSSSSQFRPNVKLSENGLLIGPPPGLSGQILKINNQNNNNQQHQQQNLMKSTNLNYNMSHCNQNKLYFTPETYYPETQCNQFLGDFSYAEYSRNLILENYKNSSISEFISVQLYQRILEWINEIDFENMNTMDELEEKYRFSENEENENEEETFSEFEYID